MVVHEQSPMVVIEEQVANICTPRKTVNLKVNPREKAQLNSCVICVICYMNYLCL
jgi:hypothetical protein